jgi:hypothetical protein
MQKRQFHRKLLRYDDHLIRQRGGKPYRDYRGFRVNVGNGTTKDNGYRDCYVDILDKIIDHVQAEQNRFRTVFIGRFDIVFKEETPKFDDNDYPYFDEDHPQDFREEVYVDMDGHRKMLSVFLNNVKKYLSKKTSDSRNRFRNHDQVKIGWVREYGSKKGWHYHLYVCLDGDRVNTWDQSNDKGLFSIMDKLWKNAAGHNHYQPLHIHSDNNRKQYKNRWLASKDKRGREQLQHAIYALSYLAKKRSKRTNNTTIKHLSTHSIPKLTTPTSEQVNQGKWRDEVLSA